MHPTLTDHSSDVEKHSLHFPKILPRKLYLLCCIFAQGTLSIPCCTLGHQKRFFLVSISQWVSSFAIVRQSILIQGKLAGIFLHSRSSLFQSPLEHDSHFDVFRGRQRWPVAFNLNGYPGRFFV